MEMRVSLGEYYTSLLDQHIDCWVMNDVPISEPNMLPGIYDHGLIGFFMIGVKNLIHIHGPRIFFILLVCFPLSRKDVA